MTNTPKPQANKMTNNKGDTMSKLTKQQQKDEAFKAFEAIEEPARKAYLAKLSEINAQEETV